MSNKSVAPSQFLNGPNYQTIVGFLRQKYTQKLGTNAIPERMDNRLQKTVQHYMTEIASAQTGKNIPLQSLNQEVIRETVTSIDTWLRKQETSVPPVTASVGTPSRPNDYSRLFEDTNTRYESMIAARSPPALNTPALPDFRPSQNFMESDEDPVLLMQRMQKQRDDQSRSLGLSTQSGPRLEISDDRAPSAMNPVPPQAEAPPAILAPRPQEYIIPQEDIVKYRDTEYNIFLTSSDRDWLRNTAETRYNFTVNFNTGTKRTGFPYNAALQERFRNIQRIEFVKAIIPIESLNTLPRVSTNTTGNNAIYDVSRVINVFSLPFIGIRIAELNNNGFSTKPEEDNTFALVQYDTTWSSDLISPNTNQTHHGLLPLTKSGYTGLIPKFLKTQKVYTPTPLATLQKLSIRMERHSGELLSDNSDVWSIARVCMSGYSGSAKTSSIATTNFSIYKVFTPQNAYIFVETTKYFPFSAIGEGDTIVFQGFTTQDTSNAAIDFQGFINQQQGHLVVATAHVDIDNNIRDGRNNVGYCNVIIIQNRFNDPSTGSVIRDQSYFGNDAEIEQNIANVLDDSGDEPNQKNTAIINLSRQSHIVLRIITREMDSSSNIRPDNV